MFFLENDTTVLLKRGLDGTALRQKVTAHNLANLNTPRFQRSDVSFEEELQRVREQMDSPLFRTHERHFPLPPPPEVTPRVLTDTTTVRRIDGNNVDLERDMINLVSNQIRQNTYVQLLNGRFSKWRYVINEGRR